MPQAKPKEPDLVGVNSRVVVANGARDLLAWKSGEHHPVAAVAGLLSVENQPQRYALLDSDDVWGVTAFDGDPYLLDSTLYLSFSGLLGSEEEPGQDHDGNDTTYGDADFYYRH